jgi:hypothetical protein
MLKPPVDLIIPRINKIKIGSCPQDIILHILVTLVLAKAFILLQNLIIK